MKLKTQKIFCIIFMLLPLVISAIALMYLPDQIPAHYGANGQVDRWGSKYEALILPLTVIPFGLFMFAIAKFSSDNENSGRNNEKVTIITNLFSLVLFNVMNLYFLYADLDKVGNLADIPIDIYSLIFTILGIGLVVIGNVMPKTKMNSIVGLRTPWNMKNEDTWRKSQRFGGIVGIIIGIIMSIGCVFLFKGANALIFSLILMTVMAIADIVYSYVISKKY